MMPGMTGMDLHRALLEKAPDVAAKMVFATGGAFTARAQEFLDATPNLRIEKPFDFAVLDRTIRAVVGRGVRRAHA
jgi:DNA-binding NarL/FixJ family response regulator